MERTKKMVRIRKKYKSAKVFVDKRFSYLKSFQSSDTHIFGHRLVFFSLYAFLYLQANNARRMQVEIIHHICNLFLICKDQQNPCNTLASFMQCLLSLSCRKISFDLCTGTGMLYCIDGTVNRSKYTESSKFKR